MAEYGGEWRSVAECGRVRRSVASVASVAE